jgi:hypothetical protein
VKARGTKASPLPHSWPVGDWPADVYPNRASAGRYLVRANRDALLACGALTRIGRELVVIGEGYARFLARQVDKVPGFVPSNPPPRGDHDKSAAPPTEVS